MGKKIYIAFVHKGSGSYALGIDDVEVTNQKGPKAISNLTVTPGENGALSATLTWEKSTNRRHRNRYYGGTGYRHIPRQ